MINDVKSLSSFLSDDSSLTEYDFWRALQTLNDDLHRIERERLPLPINLLYTRKAFQKALAERAER